MKVSQPLYNQALLVGWRFQNCSLYEDEKKATLFSQWMVMSGNRLEGWVFVWEAIVPMCRVVPEGCSFIHWRIHSSIPFHCKSFGSCWVVCKFSASPKKKKYCARARACLCACCFCVLFCPRARSLLPSRSADVGGGEEGLPQLLLLLPT
jgi:hypothetical protein